ncbi:MAG TPA: CehA/McbA family metallohydrolase, partial [Acidobacteriota bacterium]|nr:CehA/McbA family metallohydrolase [Acidobacteriota bacterium]
TVPITTGDDLNLDPAWAPDSSRLAYVSTQPNGYYNIFIVEISDDGSPGPPIQLTRDNRYGKSRLYFGDYDLHIQPAWSPDGKELLFVSNRGIPLGSGAIWRMPAVENGIDQAKQVHREETLYRTRPDWSPDGTRFIYSSHLGGQFSQLFVLPVDGGEPYKLTFGEWDHFHPRWSPDGHQIAYISNQRELPEIHILQTFGGKDRQLTIQSRRWLTPMGHVKVRIVNGGASEVSARVYTRASDGKAYVPDGAFHRVSRLGRHFFHTGGRFTLEVPPGELKLEVTRGFEYWPASLTVDVRPGEVQEATITLERMTDLKAKGWYSGSNHVHMNYGGNLRNTPENLVFMAEAEDLEMIGELVANKDNRILDYQYFTGKPHPLSSENRLLYFNEEYRPPFYGHISLINLTEHLISPFTTGYEGTAIASLYPSNTDVFRVARKQGALGAYVHPYGGNRDPLESGLGVAKGFPVDVALGTVDYLELMSRANWAGYQVWHHVLNNGFRIPVVGGEDSISDLHYTAIVGQDRVYLHLGGELNWSNWIEALRRGRGFVTNGPLLQVMVNGRMPGEEIQLPEQGGEVTVEGRVDAIVPLDRVELVVNGERMPLDVTNTADRGFQYVFSKTLPVQRSSWITLQAYGSTAAHPIDDGFPQATTNPFYVMVGDQPIRSVESAEYFLKWIDVLKAMADNDPFWRSSQEKQHVFSQFEEARQVYLSRREEALQLE